MKYLFLFIYIFCFSLVYSQIEYINSYNNEILYKEFDLHTNTILKYENRLFVQNAFKIVEYNILENGELEIVHFIETKQNFRAYLDDDRYYSLSLSEDNPGPYGSYTGYKIDVYNIAISPMYRDSTFDINITTTSRFKMFFSSQHILIHDISNYRYIQFNKQNLEPVGYYYTPNSYPMVYMSSTLMVLCNGSTLFFYQMINHSEDEVYPISEIPIPVTYDYLFDCMEEENKLIITYSNGVLVIDILEPSNPIIANVIPTENPVLSAVYNDNYVYTSDTMGHIDVFVLSDNGAYIYHSCLSDSAYGTQFRNLCLYTPYLYANQCNTLTVYDIINQLPIASYGAYLYDYSLMATNNEIFLIERVMDFNGNQNNNIYNIYNVFSNELFCQITINNHIIYSFYIADNYLYIITKDLISNDIYLDIYSVNEGQSVLSSSTHIDDIYMYGKITVYRDKVYLTSTNSNLITVYQIVESCLINFGCFFGKMQNMVSAISENYILNIESNNILIRDINDFNNILATYTLPNWGVIEAVYVNDDIFLLLNDYSQHFRAYQYNISEQTISQIFVFPEWSRIRATNGIISNSNWMYSTTSTYYSFFNGSMHQIGEKEDNRYVDWTYFYPERRKMVQFALSGIWIYDIDVTVSEADIVVNSKKTENITNYPNPFNPSTTITFSLIDEGKVTLEIYNIKGQKVRTLVNQTFSKGQHQVVWDSLDDNQRTLTSGVYFYRYQTKDENVIRKMLLLK